MATEPGVLDDTSAHYLRGALTSGAALLFTGAGFSRSAKNCLGEQIPLGWDLAKDLWPLAFPGEPFDDESSLGEVFEVAKRAAGNATGELLRSKLLVDSESIPSFYSDYLALPWFKIYTLNLDNLIPLAAARFGSLKDIDAVSAKSWRSAYGVPAIHLNGLVGEYPNVTFSPPEYGLRTAAPDPVYETLAREIYSHPVVFVGTALDEPPLWHHLALRGDRPAGPELRPKSFLVSPKLPVARRAMLDRFNIKWIALDAEQFCAQFITPLIADLGTGTTLANPPLVNYDDVAILRNTPIADAAEFLLGREPDWGDVSGTGFAVRRSCEADVERLTSSGRCRVLIVTGTAGTGKSTLLRRCAVTLSAAGRAVRWLRADAPGTVAELRNEAQQLDPEAVVVIDDSQRFGARAINLLRGIAEGPGRPVVLAAMPSTAYEELDIEPALYGIEAENLVVPALDDREIDDLIESLVRANRLGRLAGMSPPQRRNEFKNRAHRQLLVAMLEATSGKKFEAMIEAECRALPIDLSRAYVVAAIATSNNYPLPRDVLLAALSDYSAAGLGLVDRLCKQHLLLKLDGDRLAARHSVIAREAISYFRSAGQLIDGVERLAFAIASRIQPDDKRSQERRLLNRLTNHMFVHASTDSRQRIREMYEQLEPLLSYDAHYWLQRGAYEVERGDTALAENFLGSARSLSSGDFMIDTEWAYLMMRRACDRPTDPASRAWVEEAHEILTDIIADRGRDSPNTYVVLAQTTLTWLDRADLLLMEKLDVLRSVRGAMKTGGRWHGENAQFTAAAQDVESAYLQLAISPDPPLPGSR